jgi:hypothetical protein
MHICLLGAGLLVLGLIVQTYMNIPVVERLQDASARLVERLVYGRFVYIRLFFVPLVFAAAFWAMAYGALAPFLGTAPALMEIGTFCVLIFVGCFALCWLGFLHSGREFAASLLNGREQPAHPDAKIIFAVVFLGAAYASVIYCASFTWLGLAL